MTAAVGVRGKYRKHLHSASHMATCLQLRLQVLEVVDEGVTEVGSRRQCDIHHRYRGRQTNLHCFDNALPALHFLNIPADVRALFCMVL